MKKRIFALLLLAVLLAGCAAGDPSAPQTTVPENQPTQAFPGLGGVMPEMAFKQEDGSQLLLSKLLEEKELVVLNFWFADCPWCVREFPEMELVYQRHRQDVEIVALNPVDDLQTIASFREQHSLSFPMISCPRAWSVECGVSAYPTSIFIDRDGVVCLIHRGAITASKDWYSIFEAFTGEDYRRTIYANINDLLEG
jgi:peroxiredoxin